MSGIQSHQRRNEEEDSQMQTIMNNGKLTQLFPGNGFLLNGQAFVYEKYENGNCVIRDTKKKNQIYVYGYEGLKRTVRQFGYELMKGELL
jgi:hypothetical protein